MNESLDEAGPNVYSYGILFLFNRHQNDIKVSKKWLQDISLSFDKAPTIKLLSTETSGESVGVEVGGNSFDDCRHVEAIPSEIFLAFVHLI